MIKRIVMVTHEQLLTLKAGGTVAGHAYDPSTCLYIEDTGAELPTEDGAYVLSTDDDGATFGYERMEFATNLEVRSVFSGAVTYVQYIESDGVAQILTNELLDKDVTIDCIIRDMGTKTGYYRYFGGTSGSFSMFLENQSGTNNFRKVRTGSSDTNVCSRSAGSSVHIVYGPTGITVHNPDDTVLIGSLEYSNTSVTATAAFTVFNAGGNAAPIRLYSLKLYKNDALVADYRPCYQSSTNVVGLFEVLSSAFYTNDAGTLTAGPDL